MAASLPTDRVLAFPAPPAPPAGAAGLHALAERMDGHALFVLDRAGRVRCWNPGAERLTGYTEEEALGRHVSVFYGAEELRSGAPEREVGEALAGAVQAEGWWMRRDGTRLWARRHLSPLPEAGGEPGAVGVAVCDLSAGREAQRRLEEREECYRSLFEHTPDAVWTLDVGGRVTGANPAAEAVTGFRFRELLGRPFDALAEPEARERAREAAGRAGRGEPQTAELAVRRRDGRRLELDATLVPILVGGQPAGVFVVSRDATERKRGEARLRASEARFRGLVEGSEAGFFYELDGAGRFRYLSPAVRGVTGFAPDALLGRTFHEALAGDAAGEDRAEAPAEGAPFVVAVRTPEGGRRILEVVEGEAPGEGRGRHGFARDVTRWKELEHRHAALALSDPVTGLPTRAHFGDRLSRAVRAAARDPGRLLAVLVVSLDPSTPAGAAPAGGAPGPLLAEAARRLERALRPGDTLCRLEGGEFGVLLDGIREAEDAAGVARRIACSLGEPFRLGAAEVWAGARVGFAVSAAGRGTADELLRSAAEAARTGG